MTKLSEAFHAVPFNYLPQSKNQIVDALTTLSFIIKIPEEMDLRAIVVETHDNPVYSTTYGTMTSKYSLRKVVTPNQLVRLTKDNEKACSPFLPE